MFKKLKMLSQRIVIYGLLVMLGLSLSLFLGSIKPAQAAAKPKTAVNQKTAAVPDKMSFKGQPSGLHRSNTYVIGQSISMIVSISGEPNLVWINVGVLDSNFPQTIYFQNQGEGNWFLKTPKLSNDLNIGSHTIKIFAQDSLKTIQTQVKITLQSFPAVIVLSYKVSGVGTAKIDWNPINFADVYLVNWQIQGDNASNIFETTKLHQMTIENLEPGTLYEVRIQPLRGDAVGPEALAVFQTLGNALPKVVADTQTPAPAVIQPRITPSITPSAAATKKVATTSQTPQVAPTPTITPSPTSSPTPTESAKATPTGGWNKILIALSILIIAAGAAIGGYYGYEWLIVKSKDKEPPESDNRW